MAQYEVARRVNLAQFAAASGGADIDLASCPMPADLFAGPLKEVNRITTSNTHLWVAFKESDLFAELKDAIEKARAEACRRKAVSAKRNSIAIARSTPLVRMSDEEGAAAAAGYPSVLFSKHRPVAEEGEYEYATAQSSMPLS